MALLGPSQSVLVRRARFGDLNAMSTIMASAFWDIEFVGRTVHTRRERYPGDFQRWWRHKILASLLDWQHEVIVAVDAKGGDVLGVADWVRSGPNAAETIVRGWKYYFQVIVSPIYRAALDLYTRLRPYRSVSDPSLLTAYSRAMPFVAHYWTAPRDDVWDLSVCGVPSALRGRGIGRKLVAWGLDRADEEGVAASVVIAQGKETFYQNCGYGPVVGKVSDGHGNPLAGMTGGEIMFRDKKVVRDSGEMKKTK